jgi:lipopolysaccharide/colanic/teichoic acid biosynthesis glycosyltransferase
MHDQVYSSHHAHVVVGSDFEPIGGQRKRAFDLIFAAIALAVGSPFFTFAALMVKFTSRGPLFFRQERIGYGGRLFICYKFRTMVVDADVQLQRLLNEDALARAEWEACQKLSCDPRVTLGGQLLRLSSLDELPQLINVLRGDMSLVGPRPIVEEEIFRYREKFADYRRARPGITGSWQVSGRNDISFEERTELDRSYVRNWSFLGDIMIILRTIPAVLLSKGCY